MPSAYEQIVQRAKVDESVLAVLKQYEFGIAQDISGSNREKDTEDGRERIYQMGEGVGLVAEVIFGLDSDSAVELWRWHSWIEDHSVAKKAQEIKDYLNPDTLLPLCDNTTDLAGLLDSICESSLERTKRLAVLVLTDGKPDDVNAAVAVLTKWCKDQRFLMEVGQGTKVPRVRFLFLGYGSNVPRVIDSVKSNLQALDDEAKAKTGYDPAGHAYMAQFNISGLSAVLKEWVVG